MKYSQNPDVDYSLEEKIETQDYRDMLAFLAQLPSDTPVAWYSHKDEQAHPGVWLRRGNYRLKHGSFVDPFDLSCYAAQYYEAFESGRHDCLQIGRSPEGVQMPQDVLAVATVEEFEAAIRQLAPVVESPEQSSCEALEEGEEQAAALEQAAAAALASVKLLQPDYAFELHGALTVGWHAQSYAVVDEDEIQSVRLLVLR